MPCAADVAVVVADVVALDEADADAVVVAVDDAVADAVEDALADWLVVAVVLCEDDAVLLPVAVSVVVWVVDGLVTWQFRNVPSCTLARARLRTPVSLLQLLMFCSTAIEVPNAPAAPGNCVYSFSRVFRALGYLSAVSGASMKTTALTADVASS